MRVFLRACGIALLAVFTSTAWSATVVVNNGGDINTASDANCTLREAVATVNAGMDISNGCTLQADGSSDYSIEFTVIDIVLTQGVIELDRNMTIGSTAALEKTRIQASANDRIFLVERISFPIPVPERRFEFNNIHFVNGDASALSNGGGAALLNFSNTEGQHQVTVNHCEFTNNKGSIGGALSVWTPSIGIPLVLNISNSTFTENQAVGTFSPGGAIYAGNLLSVTISDSSFQRNISGREGGAVFARNTNTLIQRSQFDANEAEKGGAVFTDEGNTGGLQVDTSFKMDDVEITNNIAHEGFAGGVRAFLDIVEVRNSLISGNRADSSSGGLALEATEGLIILEDTTIQNNHAGIDGGGASLSAARVNRVRFLNNTAAEDGGGVYGQRAAFADGTLEFRDSTFAGNQAGERGGGLFKDGLSNKILNSTFNNNSAKEGGGLYLNTASVENQINNSTFSANTASKEGGGIFMSSAERSTMNNVTIAYNHAAVEGGGIYLELTPDTEITNTIIAQNTATQYPTERDCTFFGFTPTTMANSIVEDGGCNAVNIGAIQIDPELDSTLANNNGDTQSHMLLVGSPARDAGNNATCEATDQRGLTRPDAQSGVCDIGSIEAQPGEGSDGDFFIIPTKNGAVLIYL